MTGGCIFCAIVAGEAGAFIVRQDEDTVAFLDRRPLFPGHCLVVPRQHLVTLADLPADLLAPLFAAAQKIAEAMPEAIPCDGSLVIVNNNVSQSVPHLHVHVIPRKFKDGLRGFFWPRQQYASDEEARKIQESISKTLAAATH